MAERTRVEIGFEGGQIVAIETTAEEAGRLADAFASLERTRITIDGGDGRLDVDTSRVAYVRRAAGGRPAGYSPP